MPYVETDMRKEGTIEPMTLSKWTAPIVPVIKPKGSVRINGDNQ